MDLGLEGKVALVAAASRGLGRAIACELAREGATLVMCARGADALEQARDEIAADDRRRRTRRRRRRVDPRADRAWSRSEALATIRPVDVLVTNAGGPPAGTFEKHDWDVWERAVNLTLRSAVELTRAVLPGMRERKWGRVINVTSIAVKQPVDNLMLSNSIRVGGHRASRARSRTKSRRTASP